MHRKVILGHDLRDGGDDALALAKLIADTSGAKLVVAGVFPFGTLPRGFSPEWRSREADIAAQLQALADRAGAEADGFPSSSPAHGLQDLAEEIGADLIVIGSSRRGRVGEILAGNVGLGLLHGSPCAVALAPRDYRQAEDGLRAITVGVDGSHESELALDHAVDLATASDATLKLLSVAEPPVGYAASGTSGGYAELKSAIEAQRREQLAAALELIPPGTNVEGTLVSGDPAERLAAATRPSGSVLVLGSRGYGPVRRVVLGSVSAALMRLASCPVIVHPRGAGRLAGAHAVERGAGVKP